MNRLKEQKFDKKIILLILVMIISSVMLFSSSYALIKKSLVSSNKYTMNVGDVKVVFESSNTVSMSTSANSLIPMTDYDGRSNGTEILFQINNTGDYLSYYNIFFEETSSVPMADVIRYMGYVSSDGVNYNSMYNARSISTNKYIDQSFFNSGETLYFKIILWLDEYADNSYMSLNFTANIKIEAFQGYQHYATDTIYELVNIEKNNLTHINTFGKQYTNASNEIYAGTRYYGSNPNNYVWFNCDDGYNSGPNHCEKWRILGIYTTNTGFDDSESRLKIVRNDFLTTTTTGNNNFNIDGTNYILGSPGTYYGFYIDNRGNSLDYSYSILNSYLNGDSRETSTTYYETLSTTAKDMIDQPLFYQYLGAVSEDNDTYQAFKNEDFITNCPYGINDVYSEESCNILAGTLGSLCYERISLLSPSDYGYASDIQYWSDPLDNITNVATSNWLYSPYSFWLLNPRGNNQYNQLNVTNGLVTYSNGTNTTAGVRPVTYLNSDVSIIGGYGTSEKPYELGVPFPIDFSSEPSRDTML